MKYGIIIYSKVLQVKPRRTRQIEELEDEESLPTDIIPTLTTRTTGCLALRCYIRLLLVGSGAV